MKFAIDIEDADTMLSHDTEFIAFFDVRVPMWLEQIRDGKLDGEIMLYGKVIGQWKIDL